MSVSSHAVANEFLRLAQTDGGKQLTNMQLQKLVFLSQGYTLAILGDELYYHDTHAWQWGPVVPKLYKSLQKFGRDFVDENLSAEDTIDPSSDEAAIISAVWEGYGHMTGMQLSELTHKPNTPWSVTWEHSQFDVIPQELIAEHYKGLIEAS